MNDFIEKLTFYSIIKHLIKFMEPNRGRASSSLHMAKSQTFLPSSEKNP